MRVSSGWWLVLLPTNVSSRTRSACLKPASTSPTTHSSVCLPSGSWPSPAAAKSSSVHFSSWTLGPGGSRRAGCAAGWRGRTQTLPCVRAFGRPGPQALDRIDHEGQRLVFDVDALDRLGRRQLVDGRDRENRLALVERLVGQAALAERAGDDAFAEVGALDDRRQIVDGEDRLHAGHRQRRARVDAARRARAASGSGAASRTASPRRGSPRRTSPCRSPWRRDPGWCSSGRRASP